MDVVSVETGVGVIVGFVVGVYADHRARTEQPIDPYYKEPGRQYPSPGKPICGCGHHVSYHDPKTGQCKHKRTFFRETGRWTAHCSCQKYIGPEVLPEVLP